MTFLSTEPTLVPAPAPVPPAVRRRLFVVALYGLRVVATLHALLAMSQAVSIGRYLTGSYLMIKVHGAVAGITMMSALALALAALLYALAGGRLWVALVCPLFFFAEGFQTGMGYARSLGVHVPLGVVIITSAVVVGGWTWSRAASRPRVRRTSGTATTEVR
jgi:polyferredoxin